MIRRLQIVRKSSMVIVTLVLLVASFTLPLRADYRNSPRWVSALELDDRYRDKVFRDRVQPVWLDENRFRYRVRISESTSEVVEVDIKGRSRRAIDPLDDPRDGRDSLEALKGVEPSLHGGERCQVEFINETGRPILLFWVDSEMRWHRYHRIETGETIEQNTFADHVWVSTDLDRNALQAFRVESVQPRIRLVIPDKPLSRKAAEEVEDTEEPLVSPDGRFEVIEEIEAGDRRKLTLIESSPRDQLQPRVIERAYDKPGDRLDRVHLKVKNRTTGAIQAIDLSAFDNAFHIHRVRWRADSQGFTFLYNERGHQKLQLVFVPVVSWQPEVLIDERSQTFIDYSHKAFHEYLDDTGEIIWASERDGWCHLYLYDAKERRLKNQITRGDWVVRSIEHIDKDQRVLWFAASGLNESQDPYHQHLCRIGFDGKGFVQITQGDGDHEWSFSPDHRSIVDRYSRVDLAPITELRDAYSGELQLELERADDRLLRAAGWNPPERFVAKGRDGATDIFGLIFRPSHFDPNAKYPVIESIYAGPHSAHVPKKFGTFTELYQLAELGFIVVKIDGMGTSHRSKVFHDVCWKNLADAGFPDRKLWIQAAADRYPQLDIERIGIFGGSAGGQNALGALLFHGDFYDCAVSDCGCHDNRMDKIWWNEQWMGWPIGKHYEEQSNVTNAHKLKGKLLLIAGELDSNVDPASTLQVVDALIRADKDFEMLYIPGGKHGVGSQPYGRRKTWEFFCRNLLEP